MTHTAHPDVDEAGLQPGCPRCEEQASRPLSTLDADNILRLLVHGRIYTPLDVRARTRLQEALAEGTYLLALLDGARR